MYNSKKLLSSTEKKAGRHGLQQKHNYISQFSPLTSSPNKLTKNVKPFLKRAFRVCLWTLQLPGNYSFGQCLVKHTWTVIFILLLENMHGVSCPVHYAVSDQMQRWKMYLSMCSLQRKIKFHGMTCFINGKSLFLIYMQQNSMHLRELQLYFFK